MCGVVESDGRRAGRREDLEPREVVVKTGVELLGCHRRHILRHLRIVPRRIARAPAGARRLPLELEAREDRNTSAGSMHDQRASLPTGGETGRQCWWRVQPLGTAALFERRGKLEGRCFFRLR